MGEKKMLDFSGIILQNLLREIGRRMAHGNYRIVQTKNLEYKE
jgi:hypothetical protein